MKRHARVGDVLGRSKTERFKKCNIVNTKLHFIILPITTFNIINRCYIDRNSDFGGVKVLNLRFSPLLVAVNPTVFGISELVFATFTF